MPLIGIDIGTQSLKVVVTDDGLSHLGSSAAGYAVEYPRPGWAEQDPATWERALTVALPAALAAAGITAADVRGVGVAGQLDGCVAVDASGSPLAPCLIWMDRRAGAGMPAVDASRFRRITGQNADPGHMAAKVRWLRRAVPEAVRFHQPVSYLVERLTGVSVFDRGLASTTMLYDLRAGAWSAELLEAFEIDPRALPRIAEAWEVAGEVTPAAAARTGLLAGTPVAVGTGDDFATPLGAGIVEPGPVACVLGTAEVVGAVSASLAVDERGLVETHGWVAAGYFVENPGWLCGGAIAWLRELLGFASDADLDAAAASVPASAEGAQFLPALTGAMAPTWHAGARGCFYGLTAAHGRGHLARAVLEGCAFAMRDVLDRLDALGVPARRLVLLGGGANSDLWAQIRADVARRAVEVADVPDACPLGAAVLASVAAGVSEGVTAAAARVVGRTRVFEPGPSSEVERYARAHDSYLRLFAALEPMF